VGLRDVAGAGVKLLPPRLRRELLYVRAHGRLAHLSVPQTFTEKVNWRILNDRRPLLHGTCDKLAMKEHARRSGAPVRTPETLWAGTDVRELVHVDLPDHWILKPNHLANGLVHFGSGQVRDAAPLQRRTRGWLDAGRGAPALDEWAYASARRCLLVEERVGAPAAPPADYKVLVFDGEPALVQVHDGRFTRPTRTLYWPDWTPVDASASSAVAARPPHLEQLLAAAGRLAAGFDFLRVDLYDQPEGLWFGEITPYPGSGLTDSYPIWLDRELGKRWRLPQLQPATA
jgi:TupA-like ATPgrasp